jgi:hypothetical protein
MDYKEKYIKYKIEYLKLKNTNNLIGGNKDDFNKIIDFIKKSKKKIIIKKFFDVIYNNAYCPVVLGKGFGGQVYLPEIDKTFPYKIGNKTIQLPIVVKVERENQNIEKYFGLDLLDNKLYINAYGGLTTEAIILMFIMNLRHKTVHLPMLLAYSTCSNTKLIDRIYTLRYGLDEPVEIDLTGKIFDEQSLWHKRDKFTQIFKKTIATLGDLFTYIHYSKNKDDTVILPNNIKCNIIELYDYLCISFLATYHLLTENNIFPSDAHPYNIFIEWLNDNSYYNDKNIKDIEEIIYKIGNKYYKIKTFGFVLIFGDTGTFIIKIKKDIILIGQAPDIKKNYLDYNKRIEIPYTNMDLIKYMFELLTFKQCKKTIAYNIMNTEPYCNNPINDWQLLGTDISYLDNTKSTIELLEFFYDKYGVDKYEKNNNNILITID